MLCSALISTVHFRSVQISSLTVASGRAFMRCVSASLSYTRRVVSRCVLSDRCDLINRSADKQWHQRGAARGTTEPDIASAARRACGSGEERRDGQSNPIRSDRRRRPPNLHATAPAAEHSTAQRRQCCGVPHAVRMREPSGNEMKGPLTALLCSVLPLATH